MKKINDYTYEEFRKLDYFFDPNIEFNEVVLVPTNRVHDSGYRCIKYVLGFRGKIVAVIGGASDVLHLNGIGGYGLDFEDAIRTQKVPLIDWCIDCLDKSGCLRLFSYHKLKVEGINSSDLSVYDSGERV